MRYQFAFEGETGVVMGEVTARDALQASDTLAATYPDDEGADGFLTDENGKESPICW